MNRTYSEWSFTSEAFFKENSFISTSLAQCSFSDMSRLTMPTVDLESLETWLYGYFLGAEKFSVISETLRTTDAVNSTTFIILDIFEIDSTSHSKGEELSKEFKEKLIAINRGILSPSSSFVEYKFYEQRRNKKIYFQNKPYHAYSSEPFRA